MIVLMCYKTEKYKHLTDEMKQLLDEEIKKDDRNELYNYDYRRLRKF